jgi:hypothetical protein
MQLCLDCGNEVAPETLQSDATSAWCTDCLSVYSTGELPGPESLRISQDKREIRRLSGRFASREVSPSYSGRNSMDPEAAAVLSEILQVPEMRFSR